MNHRLNRLVLSLLLGGFALSACTSYSIRRYGPGPDGGDPGYQRVPGVPFYSKRAVCRQETVYQQDLVRLSFKVHRLSYATQGGAESSAVLVYASERLVDRATAGSGAVAALRMQPRTEADWRRMVGAFELLQQPNLSVWQDTTALALVKNETSAFVYVDYDNQYYLDVQRPFHGSASAATKLNPDGTLTETSVETDDATFGTIVGAIPFADLIPGWLGMQRMGEKSRQDPPAFRTTLDATAVPILHKLSTWRSDDPMPCWTSNAPITPRPDNHGYTYTRVVPSETPAAAPTGNAITVTGRIALPEAKP